MCSIQYFVFLFLNILVLAEAKRHADGVLKWEDFPLAIDPHEQGNSTGKVDKRQSSGCGPWDFCKPGYLCCDNLSCIPSNANCCKGGRYCPSGDECCLVDGIGRCLPNGKCVGYTSTTRSTRYTTRTTSYSTRSSYYTYTITW